MAKKQNKVFLIAGLGLLVYMLYKKQSAAQIPVDTAPPPVLPQYGELTISEKRQALNNYATGVGKNWTSALQKMTEGEVATVYNFIYNCILIKAQDGKCIPKPSDLERMKIIGYKYSIVI